MTGLNSTAEVLILLYAIFDGITLFATMVVITDIYLKNDQQSLATIENFKKRVYLYVNEQIILYYIALFLIFMAYVMFAGLGMALFMVAFGVGLISSIAAISLKACCEFMKPPATANNNNVVPANDINPV